MRHVLSFICEGATLWATLDSAAGTTGLLIVSGGNEVRIGAHRGMAKLARDVAAMGHPVFRFDRRGIGDSDGENGGFETSKPDLLAAMAAFRAACPSMSRVIAFGNCDAATALRLHLTDEVDTLILANPWLIEATADAPAPATARAYYLDRLRDPKAWAGLLRGAVNLTQLFSSLRSASQRDTPSSLAEQMAAQMARHPIDTRFILSARDGTAIAFKAQWDGSLFDPVRRDVKIETLDSPSHSFVSEADYAALKATLIDTLS
jgi:exosortase A-associated hydrolase 1